MKGSVSVVLGLQWGDEGKGKWVDYLTTHYDSVVRFQGGANAGHTLYVGENSEKIVLHLLTLGGCAFPYRKYSFGGRGAGPHCILRRNGAHGTLYDSP